MITLLMTEGQTPTVACATYCQAPAEDLVHLLTRCKANADTRNRIMPELLNIVAHSFPSNQLLKNTSHDLLTQFILDCSSINLSVDICVPPNLPSFTSTWSTEGPDKTTEDHGPSGLIT